MIRYRKTLKLHEVWE